MTARLLVAPEALEQAEAIDAWWRENRAAAPDLFAMEFASALEAILHVISYQRGGSQFLREKSRGTLLAQCRRTVLALLEMRGHVSANIQVLRAQLK